MDTVWCMYYVVCGMLCAAAVMPNNRRKCMLTTTEK